MKFYSEETKARHYWFSSEACHAIVILLITDYITHPSISILAVFRPIPFTAVIYVARRHRYVRVDARSLCPRRLLLVSFAWFQVYAFCCWQAQVSVWKLEGKHRVCNVGTDSHDRQVCKKTSGKQIYNVYEMCSRGITSSQCGVLGYIMRGSSIDLKGTPVSCSISAEID